MTAETVGSKHKELSHYTTRTCFIHLLVEKLQKIRCTYFGHKAFHRCWRLQHYNIHCLDYFSCYLGCNVPCVLNLYFNKHWFQTSLPLLVCVVLFNTLLYIYNYPQITKCIVYVSRMQCTCCYLALIAYHGCRITFENGKEENQDWTPIQVLWEETPSTWEKPATWGRPRKNLNV